MSAPGSAPKPQALDQAAAGKLLMLTDRHVRRLIREGWIAKELSIVGVVQGYIRYRDDLDKRRQQTAGKTESLKLKNDQERLKLKVAEGEYVDVALAMSAFGDVVGALRADLEAVPARAAGRDREQRRKLEVLIAGILNTAAGKCDEAVTALSPVGGRPSKAAGDLARRLGARKSKVPFERGRPRSTRSKSDALRHRA